MKERASERLPKFTDDEKEMLKGTSDFFCLNTYFSVLVKNHNYDVILPDRQHEEGIDEITNTNYTVSMKKVELNNFTYTY